jgi:isopenicillin N synthase-like dioxygenase
LQWQKQAAMSIKVVDLNSENAAQEFTDSLHNIGFAVLSHHPVGLDLMQEAFAKWKAFFDTDEKYDYKFTNEVHDGYVGMDLSEKAKGYDKKDIKEFFHYYPWGRCPEGLKELTHNLYSQLESLSIKLLGWIEEYTPEDIRKKFSMPLGDMIKDSKKTLYRILHYPPLTGSEEPGAIRAQAHGDINIITVLPMGSASGLQVLDKNKEWLEVPFNPGWIVINTGDMLSEITENYYPSTIHRVVNPEGDDKQKSRLSTPLFLHARDEVKLSDRYTAQSYREERYAELGLAN